MSSSVAGSVSSPVVSSVFVLSSVFVSSSFCAFSSNRFWLASSKPSSLASNTVWYSSLTVLAGFCSDPFMDFTDSNPRTPMAQRPTPNTAAITIPTIIRFFIGFFAGTISCVMSASSTNSGSSVIGGASSCSAISSETSSFARTSFRFRPNFRSFFGRFSFFGVTGVSNTLSGVNFMSPSPF